MKVCLCRDTNDISSPNSHVFKRRYIFQTIIFGIYYPCQIFGSLHVRCVSKGTCHLFQCKIKQISYQALFQLAQRRDTIFVLHHIL